MTEQTVLNVRDINVSFKARFGAAEFRVLHNISFEVAQGETLGIVGESGCGKSTLARVISGLQPITSGSVTIGGRPQEAWRPWNRRGRPDGRVQLVFQDSQSSFDPRANVYDALISPLYGQNLTKSDLRRRAVEAISATGMDESLLDRKPSELSGGQAQRIGIARALIAKPELIVLDEPTSALDVTVQAQVLELLRDLAAQRDHSFVFISHDLATVRNLCDRVIVLYLGRIVEVGAVDQIFNSPWHPYTRALLANVPRIRGTRTLPKIELARDLDQNDLIDGCPLAPRCPFSVPECSENQELRQVETGHWVACHRAEVVSEMLSKSNPEDRSPNP